MFKHFTFALCAGALFTGCILSTGDTDTDTDTNNDTTNTPVDTTAGDTTVVGTTADEPTSSTTTTETSGTTADEPTTSGTTADEPTTSETSTTTTATEGTTGTTTENTTGTVLYGNCGWYQDVESYYACEQDGGVPGAIDPMGEPILCNPGLVAGEACSDDGPVGNLGCCTEEGILFYCGQSSKIIEQDCG